MATARTPRIIQSFWPGRLWRLPSGTGSPRLFLTFDDGPTPGVTDWVLDQLGAYGAKATFFVVGEQAERHPDLLREVVRRGHTVGTHTQHHLNGWKTGSAEYLDDVRQGNQAVSAILKSEFPEYEVAYFRPPYGRIRSRDAKQIRDDHQIVMWNVLAADWRQDLPVDKVTQRVTRNAVDGSIVVFHDSVKAEPRVKGALPKVLKHFSEKGFQFEALKP